MSEVCTEAVDCVALWTRVTLRCRHVWSMYRSSRLRSTLNTSYIKVRTCVKYVPKQSIGSKLCQPVTKVVHVLVEKSKNGKICTKRRGHLCAANQLQIFYMLDSEHPHHQCLFRSFIWISHVVVISKWKWRWSFSRRQDKDPLASFLPSIFNWRPYWVPRPLNAEQFSLLFLQKVMLSSCVRFITRQYKGLYQPMVVWSLNWTFLICEQNSRLSVIGLAQLCWEHTDHNHDIYVYYYIVLAIDTYFAVSYG